MEEEEREAQSAKLQELIRRGTPADLQEANRLMKVMAGYDNRHKTDYRAKAAEEVAKVQHQAKILEEMLQNVNPGERIAEGDVFEVRWTSSEESGDLLLISLGACECPPKCASKDPKDVRRRVRRSGGCAQTAGNQ